MIDWNPDQVALRQGIEQWCEALNAHRLEGDDSGFSDDRWKLIRQSGILALPFEEQWGGLGQDLLTTMYVLEGLGLGCRDGGLSFSASTHICSTGVALQQFGSTALKERYLPAVCAGETIGAHAITESHSGSDALSMRTRAIRENGHFVLQGSKSFVTNGPVADLFVVYARTHPNGGPLGVTALVVERDTPGLEVGAPIAKMGLTTSPLSELFFDECRIPSANVIGQIGQGFLVLDHVMKWEILCSFVINVGEMQHRLERCIEYAKSRSQFGQAIGSFQSVANMIVNFKIRLETARKWLYDTAEKLCAGENVTIDIAVSKLLASQGNVSSALDAIQIFGGNGYMSEYGLEEDLRDAVAGTIYSGTSEIQYNRIASMLGL